MSSSGKRIGVYEPVLLLLIIFGLYNIFMFSLMQTMTSVLRVMEAVSMYVSTAMGHTIVSVKMGTPSALTTHPVSVSYVLSEYKACQRSGHNLVQSSE